MLFDSTCTAPLLPGSDHCTSIMQGRHKEATWKLSAGFVFRKSWCLCSGPDLDNYSYACLLLLQGQLLVEGTNMRCCALQYLLNLDLILASSLWQVDGIFRTFCVQVFDDLIRQSCVRAMQTQSNQQILQVVH